MTPEQQQIAIAEACGYEEIVRTVDSRKELVGTHPHWMTTVHHGERQKQFKAIPDYLNDLNAMHEAEKIIVCGNSEQRSKWFIWMQVNGDVAGIHASSTERAEAFLRTLGKWTE